MRSAERPKTVHVKNMTTGSPWRSLLPFAVPLMLGSAFQQVYTLTDTAVVGRVLGVSGLAALGACDLLTWIISTCLQAYTEGFSIHMANAFGAQDHQRLRRTMVTSAVLTVIAGLLLTVLMQLAAPFILTLMEVQPDIFPLALTYLRIIYAGIPFVSTYQFCFAILRAMGNSRTPLRSMMLSSLINILLDLIFVAILHLGIGGAAFATILSQAISAVYSLIHAKPLFPAGTLRSHLDFSLTGGMLGLSLPMAGQILISSIGGLVVQTVVNGFAVSFIAGYTATYKLYGLIEMAAISYGYAVTTFTSQNLGAKKFVRIRLGLFDAVKIALVTALLVSSAMLLFGEPLVGLFISGEEAEVAASVAVGYEFLCVMSYGLPQLYLLHIFKAGLQGLGKAAFATVNSFIELAVRVSIVLFLADLWGASRVFLAEPVTWTVGMLILAGGLFCTMYKKQFGSTSLYTERS